MTSPHLVALAIAVVADASDDEPFKVVQKTTATNASSFHLEREEAVPGSEMIARGGGPQ